MQRGSACLLLIWLFATGLCAADTAGAVASKPVTLAEVRRDTINERASLTGTTVAWRSAELSVQVDGLVTDVSVDEGSVVAAGDPVLVLDSRLAGHDVERAKATLAEASARRADAVRVRDELRRLQQSRHASATELETARAEVAIADAALSGARAALARAQALVDRHELTAPFAGMIVRKHVERGEWVTRGQPAVELVALERLRIRAIVTQRDYPRVEIGAGATIRFDTFPERTFEGHVAARIARGDDRSRTFPLLIDLPNPDGLLAPGMSARVEVVLTGDRRAVLSVPRDAVVTQSDGRRQVWRIEADSGDTIAQPIPVEIGRAAGDRVEIVSGELAVGDRVVLLGNENLRPGDRVDPRAAPSGGRGVASE